MSTASDLVPTFPAGQAKELADTFAQKQGLITLTSQTTTVGAATGTLTNCPTAGNPTGYIQININGVLGKIPYWV